MRTIYLFSMLLIMQCAFPQSEEEQAINKDVWNNFMQAYQDLDASLFNQIHTSDVLRVSINQGSLLVGQEYKDQNLQNFNRWNSQKVKQKIEFSFYKRIQKGNWAYEVGIYKLTRYNRGSSQSFYGKFQVTLKKVSGVWKIQMDSDTDEEGTIDESHFQKGNILDY